jgi:hypothetical protein
LRGVDHQALITHAQASSVVPATAYGERQGVRVGEFESARNRIATQATHYQSWMSIKCFIE